MKDSTQPLSSFNKTAAMMKEWNELERKVRTGSLSHYVPLVPLEVDKKFVLSFLNTIEQILQTSIPKWNKSKAFNSYTER